jgi:ribosomal protein S18 acetylase RimI-like enzyme
MEWRSMKPSDIPFVYAIANEIHKDFYEDISIFLERLTLCPEGCFVLEDDTLGSCATGSCAIGGYAISHPFTRESPPLNTLLHQIHEATCWYIHDIALLPSFRGNGATSEMVSQLTELARSRGMREITLTSVNNSHTFWKRLGFVHDLSTSCSTYGDSFFMTKTI